MSGIYPVDEDTDVEALAFQMFADTYPHEAAEQDWDKFFALCKQRNSAVTEEAIRAILKRTGGAGA